MCISHSSSNILQKVPFPFWHFTGCESCLPLLLTEYSFRRLSGRRLMYRRRYKKSAFPNREALSYPMNRLTAVCVYTDIVILCGSLPRWRMGGSLFRFLNRRERFEPPKWTAASIPISFLQHNRQLRLLAKEVSHRSIQPFAHLKAQIAANCFCTIS